MLTWHDAAVTTSELLDLLEKSHGEDVEIGVIAIVIEVNSKDGEWTQVNYRCSDSRRWVQRGFFDAAARASDAEPPEWSEDEDEDL